MRIGLVALLLVAGCDSDSPAEARDLTAPVEDLQSYQPDLAMSRDLSLSLDLAVVLDLGPRVDLCEGLRGVADGGVATNCAVEFFAHFLSCFHPTGACTVQRPMLNPKRVLDCWGGGFSAVGLTGLGDFVHIYYNGERECGYRSGLDANPASSGIGGYSACASADDCAPGPADAGPGALAYYDGVIFTCPDGSKTNIGPNLGGCAELDFFLHGSGCTNSGSIDTTCP